MTKPGVTLTGEMCLREDETPVGTGLPMLLTSWMRSEYRSKVR